MFRSQPARAVLRALGLCAALSLGACAPRTAPPTVGAPQPEVVSGYGVIEDGGYTLPAVPAGYLQGVNKREVVPYRGTAAPGTIEIDPHAKFLYWVQPDGMAMRYPIAVGREGLGISGGFSVNRKAAWPGWTPTANMLRREPEVYGPYRNGVPGGLASPLGARALYLYRNGRDTFFRIHGTNDLSSIGNSGSAGCIRMFNHDVIDLYNRVPEGTRVVVRSLGESERIEGPLMARRGVQLPAFYTGEGQRPPVPQAMVPEEYYGNPAAQGGVSYIADETDIYSAVLPGQGMEMRGGAGYATAAG
jgi:lipoprotein-anchoring transpeptidase ErfK/SrfK